MILEWEAPLNDGGCPITGYSVFRDDGITMTPTIEVNMNNDPDVRDIPTLRTVKVDLNAIDLGTTYTF
jgi:hypothetical protein